MEKREDYRGCAAERAHKGRTQAASAVASTTDGRSGRERGGGWSSRSITSGGENGRVWPEKSQSTEGGTSI